MSAKSDQKSSRPTPGKRVYLETYGCQMNVADSQLIDGILSDSGYRMTERIDDADVILVNTCAVRERAEERVLARLSHLASHKAKRPNVVLGVSGCMAEHFREELVVRAPQVDLVAGPDSYRRLPELIAKAAQGEHPVDVKLDKRETYEGAADSRVDGINGWISVQRGCDKFCTFCIVPFVRGRERSAPPREVLRQARAVVAQGAKEITLLGQTVNSYRYEGADFADLLVAVSAIDGLERLRFTSPHPLDFSPKLIETMAALPKVMPHIHLPVQSGCDDVLARMNRDHTAAQFLQLVADLRGAIEGLALTTDLIVGFPDETDGSFERTLDLVRRVRFDSAFMFMYSERSRTYAAKNLPDTVPLAIKKDRLQRLIQLQEGISAEVNAAYVGRVVPVLVTGPSRRSDQHLTGKTDTFKSTVFPMPSNTSVEDHDSSVEIAVGDLVEVEVLETTSHTLLARIIHGSSMNSSG